MECLKFMEGVFTIAFLLMLKQYFQISYQLIKKSYSSNHVLLRLTENWKKSQDNKSFVGTVLMDLSIVFDCIPHDLLAAKLHVYGFYQKMQ